MDRRRRILLHPGFHKTGTSSLQHFLWRNRGILEPTHALRMLRHMKPAAATAMMYSTTQNPFVLSDLPDELSETFAELIDDPRDIIISSEGLSGHLPGFKTVETYGATSQIMVFLTGILADLFPDAELTVLYTLRDPDEWLFSAYRHHLKGIRMTLDWDAFQRQFGPGSDLSKAVDEIAHAIAPVPVVTRMLADFKTNRFGPAGMLIDLLDLPEDTLSKLDSVGRGNKGPDTDLCAQYLELNRSALDDAALKDAKTNLAKAAGLTGWSLKS